LWSTHGKGILALAFIRVIVMVLMLAFEPFAQHLIGFSGQLPLCNNATGSVKDNRKF
jgi:hypothetical protein